MEKLLHAKKHAVLCTWSTNGTLGQFFLTVLWLLIIISISSRNESQFQRKIYQQDGAQPQTANAVLDMINEQFDNVLSNLFS
jgi:hypothetical protein